MKKTVGILVLTLIIVFAANFTVCSQGIGVRHLDYAKTSGIRDFTGQRKRF